jgi:hypothetical protein
MTQNRQQTGYGKQRTISLKSTLIVFPISGRPNPTATEKEIAALYYSMITSAPQATALQGLPLARTLQQFLLLAVPATRLMPRNIDSTTATDHHRVSSKAERFSLGVVLPTYTYFVSHKPNSFSVNSLFK